MTIKRRELLFLYESKYSIPNGDPFTGEQRYDEETKKVLVSDVRIKRFIRDYLEANDHLIFVSESLLGAPGKKEKESGASARYKAICKHLGITEAEREKMIDKVIDLRLFGGIMTIKKNSFSLTGPVQFALLNPSLNKVNLRMHQNTSVFVSDTEKNKQGAIGTTSVVPYSINQIHGWVNPYSAKDTNLQEKDVEIMLSAMWNSVNLANTRSKSNQNSLLLISINYKSPNSKAYDIDSTITLQTEKEEESIRSLEEGNLNFDKLFDLAKSDIVSEIEFYSENKDIISTLKNKDKFKVIKYID